MLLNAVLTCVRARVPKQVMVIPISESSAEYAREVRAQLRAARLFADIDGADAKMQKKVREAQLAQYNYILVRAVSLCLYSYTPAFLLAPLCMRGLQSCVMLLGMLA
jgi:hypothetical protein